MKYVTYSAVDFATDENFRRWVTDPTPGSDAYWQLFLANHPDQQAVIDEARSLVSRIRVSVELASPETVQRMWTVVREAHSNDVAHHSTQASANDAPIIPLGGTSRRWWQTVTVRGAAIAAGLLVLGGLLYRPFLAEKARTYHTDFGKKQTITLPDGSVVTLNGNSTLTVLPGWDEQAGRNVNLDGEAFFSVANKQTSGGQSVKFRVKTTDLTVEVVGTQFNVSRRRNKTDVVLQEGRVQITEAATNAAPTLMQPGERVTYSAQSHVLVKKTVDTWLFTSWQANLLIFRETPIADITRQLEDGYGLHIELRNATIGQRRFSGSVPTDSVTSFFTKLEKLYGVTVRRESGRYVIN